MKALALVLSSVFVMVGFSAVEAYDWKGDTDKLPPPAVGKMDFVKDIRPIFERSCIGCHDSNHAGNRATPRGGLRLDFGREAAVKEGRVIVPGKSDKSVLIHRVAALDAQKRMPPRGEERLSREDIGKLRAWIDQGADWPVYAPKLPDGYRLVNSLVKEEFPTEGGEEIWAEFVKRYDGTFPTVSLLVSGKKGKMFLGAGHSGEGRAFYWYPYIPADTPKVRIFIPDIIAAKVQVRRPVPKKDFWSFEGSDSSVLSPEIEVGKDAFLALEIVVTSNKNLTVGVTNIMIIAPIGATKK